MKQKFRYYRRPQIAPELYRVDVKSGTVECLFTFSGWGLSGSFKNEEQLLSGWAGGTQWDVFRIPANKAQQIFRAVKAGKHLKK